MAVLIIGAAYYTSPLIRSISKDLHPVADVPPQASAQVTPDAGKEWLDSLQRAKACMGHFSSEESAVYSTLSTSNGWLLLTAMHSPRGDCFASKQMLDLLAQFPSDQRDERFVEILDHVRKD